jgi:hypothetical protein
MTASGWSVNCGYDAANNGFAAQCATDVSWAGATTGTAIGVVSTIMSGTGTATLTYGNCGTSGGTVVVVRDGDVISSAAVYSIEEITFPFTDGVLLEIKEDPASIIKMVAFTVSCTNTACSNSFSCGACEAGKYKETSGNTFCDSCDVHASNCNAIDRGVCDAGYSGTTADDDLSTRTTMIAAGWSVDCGYDATGFPGCATDVSWAGATAGTAIGVISRTMSGTGTATLTYGNCGTTGGTAVVTLAGDVISSATIDTKKEIVFSFTDGELLEIKELSSIIKMYAFKVSCKACEAGKYKDTAGNVACIPCTGFGGNGYTDAEGRSFSEFGRLNSTRNFLGSFHPHVGERV